MCTTTVSEVDLDRITSLECTLVESGNCYYVLILIYVIVLQFCLLWGPACRSSLSPWALWSRPCRRPQRKTCIWSAISAAAHQFIDRDNSIFGVTIITAFIGRIIAFRVLLHQRSFRKPEVESHSYARLYALHIQPPCWLWLSIPGHIGNSNGIWAHIHNKLGWGRDTRMRYPRYPIESYPNLCVWYTAPWTDPKTCQIRLIDGENHELFVLDKIE